MHRSKRSKYDHVHRVWDLPDSGYARISLPELPNELLREIADRLNHSDLKNIRFVCSRLQDLVNPLIFTTAICAARRSVFETFKALSEHPKLSQNVTQLVYDSSSFDQTTVNIFQEHVNNATSPPDTSITTSEGREKYLQGYREENKILGSELSSALVNALKGFPNLRRIIYADFGRVPCFQWDRVEVLQPGSRLGSFDVPEAKNEALQYPLIQHLEKDTSLRPMYLGFTILMRELFQADCKPKIDDLRLGDNGASRGKGGIPDTLFMALFDGSYGPSTALFDSVRKLDVTFTYCTRCDHAKALHQFHHLQLLRLVGPICDPHDRLSAPVLLEPVVQFPASVEDIVWPQLRALELKWVATSTANLLAFLGRHKDTLRFINLYEVYLDERNQCGKLISSLHSMYPNLTIGPTPLIFTGSHYSGRILCFTLYDQQAELANEWPPSITDSIVEEYDEDKVSNFFDSDGEESLPEEERWSSEELDYSEDGALPDGDTSDEEDRSE
ncbi:MAG: hypothetical protein Q9221_000349 [Calogaya cf. arnoldii]